MANIKSQIKRNKTNEKKRLLNKSKKSSCHTAIVAVEKAVKEGKKDAALKALAVAHSKLDKLVTDGVISKNKGARTKSHLDSLVNTLA